MGGGQAEFVVWREIPVARKCERAGGLAVCTEVGQGLVVVVFPINQCFVVLNGGFLFFHAYAAFKREVVPVCLFYTEKAVMADIVVNQHRLLDGFGNGGKRAGFLSQILHAPAAFQTAYGLVAQLDTGVVCFVVEEVFYCIACFFVVVVVVAVQVYAQGFKTGQRLLPFGAEFVAFVAQVYPRFAVVGMGVCIIVVVEAAAQARIVVIDVFFGQQVRIKLQIAFVNQTLLPDDVGVAVVVEMAVGRQAVAVATVAVRYAEETFIPNPRQPDAACF